MESFIEDIPDTASPESKISHYQKIIGTRYNLLQKLGDGTFSDVYKGHDNENNQKIALKVIQYTP